MASAVMVALHTCIAISALVTAASAQGYPAMPQQEERYADSAPDNLIPSVPWPEWLPSDLSSIPSGLPQSGQWAPVPGNGGGNPPPQGEVVAN